MTDQDKRRIAEPRIPPSGTVLWKEVLDTNGRYEISNTGLLRNRSSGQLLHGFVDRYRFVRLPLDGRDVKRYIHRLVAAAFVLQPDGCNHVNHLDANKTNNNASNLEWTTQRGNNRHSHAMGLHPYGETHPWAKLTQAQADAIKRASGCIPSSELAKQFGIMPDTVRAIRRGKIWKPKQTRQ